MQSRAGVLSGADLSRSGTAALGGVPDRVALDGREVLRMKQPVAMPLVVLTIGHSTRTAEAFIDGGNCHLPKIESTTHGRIR